MNLIGYIRVSTDEQVKEGVSIDVQRFMIIKFCQLHGHSLVSIAIDDGVTSKIPFNKRAGGHEVISALRDGLVTGVVCQRFDRMFRKLLDGAKNFDWYEKNNYSAFSINEPVDAATPEGRMMLGMILITAQYERDKIEQRAREVSQSLKQQGKCYGHVPFGMVRQGDNLFKDPVTWEKRQHLVYLRNEKHFTIRQVCKAAQDARISNPTGGKNWSTGTLLNIVKTHHEFDHIPFLKLVKDTEVST